VERIYVHEQVADAFVTALVERAIALRMGPGSDPDTRLGPLVDERLRRVVHEHVTAAVADGAKLHCGGQVPAGPGTFYPATVLSDCRNHMTVMREETFGPVAAVAVVGSYDDALKLAAEGDYGLAATVLTPSPANAQQAWRELDVGTVKVNAVFGGAPGGAAEPHRRSGTGFGYGPELLDEVTRTRVVHLEAAP
jgi:succinate-semialdehyde dehydrogenase/glutarate-semialdehyde dehydrogenase